MLETIPQAAIQAGNNTLLQRWNIVGIISTVISGIMLCNGVYFFIYHRFIKGRKWEEIVARMNVLDRLRELLKQDDAIMTDDQLGIYLESRKNSIAGALKEDEEKLFYLISCRILNTKITRCLRKLKITNGAGLLQCSLEELEECFQCLLEIMHVEMEREIILQVPSADRKYSSADMELFMNQISKLLTKLLQKRGELGLVLTALSNNQKFISINYAIQKKAVLSSTEPKLQIGNDVLSFTEPKLQIGNGVLSTEDNTLPSTIAPDLSSIIVTLNFDESKV